MDGQQAKFMQRLIIRDRKSLLLKQQRIKFSGASLLSTGIHPAGTHQTRAHSASPLTSALSTKSTQPTQPMQSIVGQTTAQHLVVPTSFISLKTQTPVITAVLVLMGVQHTRTPLRQLMAIVRC